MSPYGRSKLMTEWMLADVAAAHPLKVGVLRYFNVAGADPKKRSGQSTPLATHLIKVAAQTALGQRAKMDIFGTDYPTPDGTCVRDYIHVTDLIEAHKLLLEHLRGGGDSLTLNCAYGQGYSVRQVVDTVKDVSGVDFRVDEGPRRAGDPASITATGEKIRSALGWQPAHDDLREMVSTALDWERYLMTRNS
jgi:UDP-glucose 4-epimerase